MYQTLKTLELEKDIVIFKGTGEFFCAGGDIKAFSRFSTTQQNKKMYRYNARLCDLVADFKKPFIALADGVAMGAAATFAQTAKYRVVTERSVFAMPETAIGYVIDSSSNYFLPRLNHNIGIYLGMTGTRLKGFDLKKVNLASHFIESSKLNDLEKKLITCKSHEEVENVLDKFSTLPSSISTDLDAIIPHIKKCFSGAAVEEIYHNLRVDGSDWAMNTIKTLNKMSPTSLKVCHRAMNLGKNLSLRDCLKMEFRIVVHHSIKSDLKEGVRAVLIDKDFKPEWNPKTVYDVTEENVIRFFKPLPDGDELTFERLRNKL